MYEPDVEEAHAGEISFTLTWWHHDGSLSGKLVAENVSTRSLRLSGKPDLTPLDEDGAPLPAETAVTLEFMSPGYVTLEPGDCR